MTPRQGTLALAGAGEFLDSMGPVDTALLERAGGNRVVILPTASAPDGRGVPERWAQMGVRHFAGLGAEAVAVMALDRRGCLDPSNVEAVRRAHLIYLSGGKPDYLLRTLDSTPLWQAAEEVLTRGGVLAGCSAGAMVLGGWIPGRPAGRHLSLWQPAFGLLPGTVILPHFDELPGWISAPLSWFRPRPSTLVGIDAGTVLIAAPGTPPFGGEAWQVRGSGSVLVQSRGRAEILRDPSRVEVRPDA